ncbi:MAG: hypothetical protein QG635_2466 [Bacteroidota bacterium]|nr:hypothetical protein [Bacteroidota bacterium]
MNYLNLFKAILFSKISKENLISYLFALIIFLIGAQNHSAAEALKWKATGGPSGGLVKNIKDTPDGGLTAITYSAAYHSTDKGLKWSKIQMPGFEPMNIFYRDANIVFTLASMDGSQKNQIWRSDDNCQNWSCKSAGRENRGINNLGYNGENIYACTDSGVYESADLGESWSRKYLVGIATTKRVEMICFNSENSVFIGTFAGLFRSTDEGANWTLMNLGPNDSQTNINNLLINERDEIFTSIPGKAFRSTDKGDTWTQIGKDILNSNLSFFYQHGIDEYYTGISWAGVFHTIDNGDTWTKISYQGCYDMVITDAGEYLLATSKGICYFSDFNDPPEIRNQGINESCITAIEIIKGQGVNSGAIIAGDETGTIHRSTDGGTNWNLAAVTSGSGISSIKTAPNGNMFAGTIWGGVYRSTDFGVSWEPANNGVEDPDIKGLVIDNNGNIFAGSFSDIYKSTDDGETWTVSCTQGQSIQCYSLAKNSQGWIFAGTYAYGVLCSSNGGSNWIQLANGLATSVEKVVVDKNDIVYAITVTGALYVSKDNGAKWNLLSNDKAYTALFCLKGSELLAGYEIQHQEFGILKSTDGGVNWVKHNDGIENIYIYSFDLDNNGYVYTGTSSGVYRSEAPATGVDDEKASDESISIFPNPANDMTTVIFPENEVSYVTGLYDSMGNEVKGESNFKGQNGNGLIINTANLAQGVYYLKISSGGKSILKPLMVLKQ